jgi:hypothetical protein
LSQMLQEFAFESGQVSLIIGILFGQCRVIGYLTYIVSSVDADFVRYPSANC